MKNKKILGNIILIFTAMIWGTAFAFQRVGMEHIGPVTFTASRMTLAAIAVGIIAFVGSNANDSATIDPALRKKANIKGGLALGFFLCSASLFQQAGMVYTSAGKAGFITAMYILLVPIFNIIIFRKKSSLIVWISVFIGVIGMYLLCINEGLSLSKGDSLVAFCAILFSGHILCADHFVKNGDPVCISAIQFALTAAVSWVIAFIAETPTLSGITSALIPILYCGLISGGLGYTLQIVGQKYTDPTIASLLMSMESVFAVIGGAVILNEHLSTRELIGCIVMFVAIILVQIPLPSSASYS